MAFGRQNSLGAVASNPVKHYSFGTGIQQVLDRQQQGIDSARANEQLAVNKAQQEASAKHFDNLQNNFKATAQAKIEGEENLRNNNIASYVSYLDSVGVNGDALKLEEAGGTPQSVEGHLKGKVLEYQDRQKQKTKSGGKTDFGVFTPSEQEVGVVADNMLAQMIKDDTTMNIEDARNNPDLVNQARVSAIQSLRESNSNFRNSGIRNLPSLPVSKRKVKVGDKNLFSGDVTKSKFGENEYSVNPDGTVNPTSIEPREFSTYEDYTDSLEESQPQLAESLQNLNDNWGFDEEQGSQLYDFLYDLTGNDSYVKDTMNKMASKNAVKEGGFGTSIASIPIVSQIVSYFDSSAKSPKDLKSEDKKQLMSGLARAYQQGKLRILKDEGMNFPSNKANQAPAYNFEILGPDGLRPLDKEQLKKFFTTKGESSRVERTKEEKKAGTESVAKRFRDNIKNKRMKELGLTNLGS